jgi:HAD superfamily hydrolase (TIGR01509 family)
MSGGLFIRALEREIGRAITPDEAQRLRTAHADAFVRRLDDVRPLPGARELLVALTGMHVPWAIATSGSDQTARPSVALLGVGDVVPLITRDQVEHAKPNPDLFLAAAARLGVNPNGSFVVGDSVWDMLAARQAGALAVGLLSGGYGKEELAEAGTYRVYDDPADLLAHLDELGIRAAGLQSGSADR